MARGHPGPAAPRLVVRPLLEPDFPTTAPQVQALRDRNLLAYATIQPLFELRQAIQNGRTAGGDTIRQFLEQGLGIEEARRRLYAAIRRARVHLHEWLDPRVPPEYRDRLGLDEDNALPDGFDELLGLMFESDRGERKQRIAFAARRRFELAQFLIQLDHGYAAPERNRELATRAEALLSNEFFAPQPIEERVLYTNHDPANELRCTGTSFNPLQWGSRREAKIAVRHFRDRDNVAHPVLASMRVKEPLSIHLRMHRDGIPQPDFVQDIRGVRLVCFSHDDRRACFESLMARFPRLRHTINDYKDLYSGTATRRMNRYSSRYFRALKFTGEFDGTIWEFQIMHIVDYVNLWISSGAENWYRYRNRQLLELFLPQFFPRARYGIRWHRDAVHRTFDVWAVREPRRFG